MESLTDRSADTKVFSAKLHHHNYNSYCNGKRSFKKSENISNKLEKTSWIKIALRKAVIRALIAFVLVLLLAFTLRILFPTYATLSVSIVIPLVGIFAALVAFSMTYAAVFSTGRILDSKN